MRIAKVVIGANFGDEGKGKVVDAYATANTTVIRANGGAQAGHTVIHAGKRHVFHHFGSGSFKGAATYLSRYFINNPILYFQELTDLNALGLTPRVVVDPAGLVTTPWDMMINQMVEQMRGAARHGSCGVGINETIKRQEAGFSLVVGDLNHSTLYDRLQTIRSEWVPTRLAELAVSPSDIWRERLASTAILDTYITQCRRYYHQSAEFDWSGDLIFEGAQGLLLDQDHHFFPHVTHSHTGLHNVAQLAAQAAIDDLEVSYVTRVYATRHGAGPFPHEIPDLVYEDQTNVPNSWQGHLRFGYLDLDLLAESISRDLRNIAIPCRHGLVVTCLDQVEHVTFWQSGQHFIDTAGFVRQACAAVGASFCYTSAGVSMGLQQFAMV